MHKIARQLKIMIVMSTQMTENIDFNLSKKVKKATTGREIPIMSKRWCSLYTFELNVAVNFDTASSSG